MCFPYCFFTQLFELKFRNENICIFINPAFFNEGEGMNVILELKIADTKIFELPFVSDKWNMSGALKIKGFYQTVKLNSDVCPDSH